MKLRLVFLFVFLAFLSCKRQSDSKIEREGEPDVFNVSDSDAEMNIAMETARNTIGVFTKALESENPDMEFFTIKQQFSGPNNDEHIWITDIEIVDGELTGTVNNDPIYTTEIKLGDAITIDKARISDWMFFEKGVVKGGYTMKVIRNNMSEEERKQFDLESGLIFED